MPTYLLTWNPDKFAWDQLDEEAKAMARGEAVESRWSCGNTKSIGPGERIFMLKQGRHGRGIVGAGWTVRGTYQDAHWDPELARQGIEINYVRMRLDSLLQPNAEPILNVESIASGPLADVYWGRPASGTTLEEPAATALEALWAEHIDSLDRQEPHKDAELSGVEGATRLRLVRHRQRERRLREAKVQAALAAAPDGRLHCEVPHCAFDFEDTYGELGRGFAEVHHLQPLAVFDGPVVVKLDDLAVVCANCHAMIHRFGECRPLESLIRTAG